MAERGSIKRTVSCVCLKSAFASILLLLAIFKPRGNIHEGIPPFRWLTSSSTSNIPIEHGDLSPFWEYSYIIVTYHKSGHELSHKLVGYMQKNLRMKFGRELRVNRVSPRAHFNTVTKCSKLSLPPGTITVIEAPEFHCHEEQLADLLMGNPDLAHDKRGVKLVHLGRNPFTMAVSNYHFHSQDPTPEPFVHWTNPCNSIMEKQIGPGKDNVADLATPILSHPNMEMAPGEFPIEQSIVTHEDFEGIVSDCRSIYQTRPGLTDATYYEHLRTLDPRDGLRMATTDKFNNFALMASDLLMFRRVQQLIRRENAKRGEFDLLTMAMDDWISRPRPSMHQFLDFMFCDGIIPESRKNSISKRYENAFFKESMVSDHMTNGKNEDAAMLIEYLRADAVFGGPLARIEALFEGILHLQSTEQ